VFLAQFDLKENQCGGSALCAQRSPQRCRTGATGSFAAIRESVSRNVLPDLIKRYRRSCALADLLAVIGTLSRCSAWMAASIVSIFHFGITWLVMIASHSAAHVSPLARANSKPR
jgi:hypothetical protein